MTAHPSPSRPDQARSTERPQDGAGGTTTDAHDDPFTDAERLRVTNLHDVFQDPCCRYVLSALHDADGGVCIAELAADLTAATPDDTDRDASTTVRHVSTELAELGLAVYDPRDGVVALADDVAVSVTPPCFGAADD